MLKKWQQFKKQQTLSRVCFTSVDKMIFLRQIEDKEHSSCNRKY
jgi:hypothetical protein